jgi:hypothetical protein
MQTMHAEISRKSPECSRGGLSRCRMFWRRGSRWCSCPARACAIGMFRIGGPFGEPSTCNIAPGACTVYRITARSCMLSQFSPSMRGDPELNAHGALSKTLGMDASLLAQRTRLHLYTTCYTNISASGTTSVHQARQAQLSGSSRAKRVGLSWQIFIGPPALIARPEAWHRMYKPA